MPRGTGVLVYRPSAGDFSSAPKARGGAGRAGRRARRALILTAVAIGLRGRSDRAVPHDGSARRFGTTVRHDGSARRFRTTVTDAGPTVDTGTADAGGVAVVPVVLSLICNTSPWTFLGNRPVY
ncbi:hypothetical protein ABZV51_26585, partial [Streptomyces avermitilis]